MIRSSMEISYLARNTARVRHKKRHQIASQVRPEVPFKA
jgi:hypothetical protein